MLVRDIKESEMFLVPVQINGRQVESLSNVRAFVPGNESRPGIKFKPTGEMFPSMLDVQRRIAQDSIGNIGYAYAFGPVQDETVTRYDRVQAAKGWRQLWESVDPIRR